MNTSVSRTLLEPLPCIPIATSALQSGNTVTLFLGHDEYDATRFARFVRNDSATEEVSAHGNSRGKGPDAADHVAALGSLELRDSGRPGCVRRAKVALGSEDFALCFFAEAGREDERVRGRERIAPAAGRMPARELHDHADVSFTVRAQATKHPRLQDAIEAALQQPAVDRIRVEAARIVFVLLFAQLRGDLPGLSDEPLGRPRGTCGFVIGLFSSPPATRAYCKELSVRIDD